MATVLVPCNHAQLSYSCWINAAATRTGIAGYVVAKPVHFKRTFEFRTKRMAAFPGKFPELYLQAVQTSQHKGSMKIEAKFKKGRKSNNSGDNWSRFGPFFAKGNSGIDSPVPVEQQPINEYQNLVDSVLFSWAVGDVWAYSLRLSAIGAAVTVLLGWPIMAWNVNPEEEFIKCAVGALCGGLLAATLAALRMYLGWAYVGNRLFSATVEYEETGWYDGEIWVKPPEVLARDRLLGSYKVKPALNRVKFTLISLAASLATCTLFFLALEDSHGDAPTVLESMDEFTKQSYGRAYNDASARMFEPDAFANENETGLPDYCH